MFHLSLVILVDDLLLFICIFLDILSLHVLNDLLHVLYDFIHILVFFFLIALFLVNLHLLIDFNLLVPLLLAN